MADEYSINAKITADASGFKKGIKDAQKASQTFSKSVSGMIQGLGKNGLVGALGAVGLASSGLSATFGTIVKVAKQVSKAVNECTEAYKTQLIAERQLDIAIQNNPFVTGESANALKQFASEIQKVSNYGDEQLIPLMANLVSLGRTEAETMDIIRVATDMSASGAVSLETAINQLNMTLNGNIGRLGMQNAELKDLTEEELKSGKAVEILGKKYKGLAEATADTSKQLQNIKGDFKEALGQFTLPSSDMWNKFWSGFYTKGIEIINQFNDYLDKNIIGKQMAQNMESYYRSLKGNEKGENVQSYLWTVSDDELKSLNAYLSGLKKLSESQQVIYDRAKREVERREYLAELRKEETEYQAKEQEKAQAQIESEQAIVDLKQKYLEKIAEQEAKWANIKKVTGEAVKNEERLKFYQDQLVAIMTESNGKITESNEYYKDQMKIIQKIISEMGDEELSTKWQEKLFELRIEQLERERDAVLDNEELTYEEKVSIAQSYIPQLVDMKLKQLEKEKEEALSSEENTEEERLAIEEYYLIKRENLVKDEQDIINKIKKEGKKEEEEIEKSYYLRIYETAQKSAKKIADVFKNTIKTIGNVISKIGSMFTNIINFNPDEALDNLLKFEDAVLTFFVETLPKLPAFFSSAVQSVVHLITSLLDAIDFDDISNILESIINAIGKLITSVSEYININGERLAEGLSKLVSTIIKSISDWIASGGWKELLNAILTIQKAIEKVVMDNIDDLVNTIVAMLPDLINALIESIVSASRTLAKLIKPILKLIIALIKALIEVALSDEVMDAMIEVLDALIEAIFDIFLNELPRILPKLITKMTMWIPKITTKITATLIKSIIKVLVNTNWGEVFWEIFMGIKESIEELGQGIMEIVSDLFKEFGEIFTMIGQAINKFWNWMVEGATYFFHGVGESLWTFFTGIGDNIKNFFQGIYDWLSNGWNWIIEGVSWAVEQIKNSFEWAFNGIKNFFDGIFQGITWGIQQIQQAFQWLKGGWDWFWGGPKSWFGWATGTNDAPHGLALVGEAGPELVRFNGGEQVLNTRNTQKLLADAGKEGGNTFNVTFNNLSDTTAYAMMQQLKQYNRQMAINGVI